MLEKKMMLDVFNCEILISFLALSNKYLSNFSFINNFRNLKIKFRTQVLKDSKTASEALFVFFYSTVSELNQLTMIRFLNDLP